MRLTVALNIGHAVVGQICGTCASGWLRSSASRRPFVFDCERTPMVQIAASAEIAGTFGRGQKLVRVIFIVTNEEAARSRWRWS